MKKALYIIDNRDEIYAPGTQAQIAELVNIYAPHQRPNLVETNPDLLRPVEVVLTGWGAPRMDEVFLDAAPHLQVVLYAGGSIRPVVTDAFWERDIAICSAWAANGIPVAEFAVSQILYSLKWGYRATRLLRATRDFRGAHAAIREAPGGYHSVVGIVGLGMIGGMVAKQLKSLDVHILAHDPFVDGDDAREFGAELASLDEIFARSNVVSLHAPWISETERMIRGEHFASMVPNATFINTARGALVCEDEMIQVLTDRPDLSAILDVTYPEPPFPESPLWDLPNVVLSPHMAGSIGAERYRMGRYMMEELGRFVRGERLKWRITAERLHTMA